MLRKLKIRDKILLVFSIPLSLMVIVAFVLLLNVNILIENESWTKHTQKAISVSRELERLVIDLEVGQKGFLLTGNKTFLEPFNKAKKVWNEKIIQLKNLVSDNSRQVLLLEEVDGRVKHWLKVTAKPEIDARIESLKTEDTTGKVVSMVNVGTGQETINSIREKLNIFINVESDLLIARDMRAKNSASNTIKVTIVGTLLAILITFLSSLLLSRPIADSLRVFVEKTIEISNGDLAGRVRIKNIDEIGTLAKAFNDMTQRLSEREISLRKSEERFRVIFNQAAVGFAQVETKTGLFVKVNQRYCDIVGFSHAEMTSTTFMKITHSDDLQDYLDNVQKLVKGKIRDFSLNKRYHRKDGSTIWINLTASPMWNIGEQPKYLILVAEDITARKLSEEKLELLSTTDQLTGVYNRRAFDEFFTRERERAVRYNKPLSLILFDIDYFKKVNDTFGHEAGDHVLQEVVNIAKGQIRKVDLLFRWGGEEFVLLLPESEIDGAICVAERLRSAVEKWEFQVISSITISLGVSQLHPDDSDKTLIKRADVALYEAKQGGRNRVVISRFSESGII